MSRRAGVGSRVCRFALSGAVVLLVCTAGARGGEATSGRKRGQAEAKAKLFEDVTQAAGIRHVHHKCVLDAKLDNIMPWMASVGASVAAVDYDFDGHIDLYLTNSAVGKPNALCRNKGDGTFEEVAGKAGVAEANREHGVSMDAVFGDYDNDGDLDLYVVKWGRNILYRNNGDGTFTDVTAESGTGDPGNGNAAVWVDYDGDNDLDLYIGNYFPYVDLWNLENTRIMHNDFEMARNAGRNVLYRNNGDGTFTNVAAELGVDDPGWTLDVGCADYDNDGDQDIVLANDFGHDRVFRNNGDGTFTNVTDEVIGWDTYKGMNVDFGDYNNDGWLDLYITNIWTREYVQEGNQLYRNMGDGTFTDISFEANVYDAGWAWSAKFWDYDNDGDLDLICANGYISAGEGEYFTDLAMTVTQPGFDPTDAANWPRIGNKSFAGYETMRVWRNEGGEVFREVAAEIGLDDRGDGRGLATADFDNDGRLDVYVSNQGQPGKLYRNVNPSAGNWLQVELRGKDCNRFAIGARVTLRSEGLTQIREMDGGNADHCQNPYRLHFGLGARKSIESLEVRWPCGFVQRVEGVEANKIITVTEETPESHLAERRKWREAMLAAARTAREEKAGTEKTNGTGEAAEVETDWGASAGFKKDFLRLKTAVAKAPDDAKLRFEFAMVLDRGGRRSAALAELEKATGLAPESMRYMNIYRTMIRAYGYTYFDRSIRFFEELAEAHPQSVAVRINKALAYVDKMPSPETGIVSQGTLSNKSIDELNRVLELDPGCWQAVFIRGMNHLHWPRKLNHLPSAIADFERVLEMQQALPSEQRPGTLVDVYVALGDAYIKGCDSGTDANVARAREWWNAGLAAYPDTPELKARLEMLAATPDKLIDWVGRERGLEDPVDTDLSRIWVIDP